MKVSKALRAKLNELDSNFKVDSDDATTRKAAGLALSEEKLSMEDYQKLVADPQTSEANEFVKAQQETNALLKTLAEAVLADKKAAPVEEEEKTVKDEESKNADEKKTEEKKPETPEWHGRLKSMLGVEPSRDDNGEPRVKGAWEKYKQDRKSICYPSHNKAGQAHPFAGQEVYDFTTDAKRPLEGSSELDKAVSGSYFKLLVSTAQSKGSRSIGFHRLPDEDKELLYYAMDNYKWGGASDGGDYADIVNRKLTRLECKALIDDATSGGLEAAPIVFDDEVIQTPLLNGELFPLVQTKPIDRGRRVEGVATGTVTGSWGGVDDSSISLFNTNSYVSAFDTTIFRWEGAIRIGLDFLSDTPVDFGSYVTEQYGERLLEDLDDVIAAGNGTTQPEGVSVASGTTSVSFGSATSLGNYESLFFGIGAAELRPEVANSLVFCGTYTSYQRMRAIPVGAADARRLFGDVTTIGGTNGGYRPNRVGLDGVPYKINESLTNSQVFCALLGRYRMYRRRGLTVRTSMEGDTLIRANEMLITCTARYGGRMTRGACAAVTSDAPA